VNLRCLLSFRKGKVLLQEVSGHNLESLLCTRWVALLSSLSLGDGDKSALFVDHGALSTFSLLVILDVRLNHNFVLVEEVELRLLIPASWCLISVIRNDSFCDLPIVLGVLIIQHHEEEIETREKRVRKADVSAHWLVSCILTIDRVGSSNY